jgi:CelD/BcsL family acetyltransferase involved in cellulose biosynthesis
LLHTGPLIAARALDAAVEPGAAPAIDLAASADDRERGFLRAAWYAAAADGAPLATLCGRTTVGGEPAIALPLMERRAGPLRLREVGGSYWPYRSFPLARDVGEDELVQFLDSAEARAALGTAWRLGPVHDDDPAASRLVDAARRCGWTVLSRRIATLYAVDLERLTAEGSWPSTKTLRKNRWLERRLAEAGELDFRTVSGADWSGDVFDLLAHIELQSWVGRAGASSDAKFLRPENRRIWERAVSDPILAEGLACSLLHVGGVPAAFTFSLRSGATLHFIANSYSLRFADRSPGRILLYRDLQAAATSGVERVDWGAGDPGYKSEMGAKPGPDIVDHLFVRGPLAWLARPLWRSR